MSFSFAGNIASGHVPIYVESAYIDLLQSVFKLKIFLNIYFKLKL